MVNNNLKIYNTLSRKKEKFKPIKKGVVHLFVCGPTVYSFPHIGHARTYIIFDCFVKYLKFCGFKVFYLQNITDVDDKIIAKAREKEVSPKDLAEAFTKEHLKDMKALGVNSVTKYAKATSHIPQIISQVKRLMEKGYAYTLEDGIYFDINRFKQYGRLSGRTTLQAEDGISRIDYAKNKKNRGDFCLWKFREEHNENEPFWNSPFGKGRPGWHIEDTAITEKFFGPQYDIHGGGLDLLFPHHEAEVSQMEAISGKRPLAQYWMHVGLLTVGDQKMGKSLNNFVLIDTFLKRYSYQQLRFWALKNLWHSPLNYSEGIIMDSKMSLERIEEFLRKLKTIRHNAPQNKLVKEIIIKAKQNFFDNLDDDFNTPKAFAVIFEFINKINKLLDLPESTTKNVIGKKDAHELYRFFEEINSIFDIIDFKKMKKSNIPDEVKKLLQERENYRKNSEWQKADEARVEIEKYGYEIADTKEGPVLRRL